MCEGSSATVLISALSLTLYRKGWGGGMSPQAVADIGSAAWPNMPRGGIEIKYLLNILVGFQAKLALPKAMLAMPNISGKANIAYKMVSSQSKLCLKINIITITMSLKVTWALPYGPPLENSYLEE